MLVTVFLALLACGPAGGAPDCRSYMAGRDDDGDGYRTEGRDCVPDALVAEVDCDDGDPTVHPDAVELCDGIDQDCDGAVDDDVPLEQRVRDDGDRDGDGWHQLVVTACTQDGDVPPFGQQDCAPDDPARHPGADETCNRIDDDCDGVVDEDAIDAQPAWRDEDGDGWGGEAVVACPGDGLADRGGDCDDGDFTVRPGHAEACDGVDEDCDGVVDFGPWYRDADGDGYGDAASRTLSCPSVPPRGYVATGDDCDDGDDDVHPGAPEWCDGTDDDCDGLVDGADPDSSGDATWYADADADGHGSLLVIGTSCERPPSADLTADDCDDDDPSVHPGAVDTPFDDVDGDCDGALSVSADAGAESTMLSSRLVDWADVEPAGLLIETWSTAYLWRHPPEGVLDAATADASVAVYGNCAVHGVADVDGDGVSDFVDIHPAPPEEGGWHGLRVFSGAAAGALAEGDAIGVRDYTGTEANLGVEATWVGDADGDGDGEIALAGESAVCVDAGPLTGASAPHLTCLHGNAHVAGVGDIDGDGWSDLATGGGVWLGMPPDGANVDDADMLVTGASRPGPSLGDIDGDGLSDWTLYEVSGKMWFLGNVGSGDVGTFAFATGSALNAAPLPVDDGRDLLLEMPAGPETYVARFDALDVTGTLDPAAALGTVTRAGYDNVGIEITALGDLDGDGIAEWATESGAPDVYVFRGVP